MKRLISLTVMGLGVMLCCLGSVAPAWAASSAGTGQALEIAPPLITLKANPGQTINTTIQLRDISSGSLVVTNEINDFLAAGEDGTPKIITGNDASNPFSLKNWISPLPSFLLDSQKIKTLSVSIKVPPNASPGGHYGVIRFTGTPPQVKGTGVALSASIGTLVLLTVNGKLNDNITVAEFSANSGGSAKSLFESTPVNFVVRLKNSGNVQEQPVGHIAVSDMFGKAIANININVPPRNVLPASIRKFTGSLDKTNLGSKHLFGRYRAVLTLSYGFGTQKTLSSSLTFWVIPFKLIAVIIVLLIVAFFVLRELIKRYNQRIIRRVQAGQQPPAKKKSRRRKK